MPQPHTMYPRSLLECGVVRSRGRNRVLFLHSFLVPFSVPFYPIEYHIGAEPPQEWDCVHERTALGGVRDSNTEVVRVSRGSSGGVNTAQ